MLTMLNLHLHPKSIQIKDIVNNETLHAAIISELPNCIKTKIKIEQNQKQIT
jgi:hypothetical protein